MVRSIKLGDVKPLFINNLSVILSFACGFMFLLGGIKFYLSGLPQIPKDIEKLEKEIVELTSERQKLKDAVTKDQNDLDNLLKRADTLQVEKKEDVLLQVDSERVPVFQLSFLVNPGDTDVEVAEIRSEYLNSAYRDSTYAYIEETLGNSVSRYNLLDLITVSTVGKNAEMKIRVIYKDTDTASKIAETIFDYLRNEVGKKIPGSSAVDIEGISYFEPLENIRKRQIQHESDIKTTNEAISEIQDSLDQNRTEYEAINNKIKEIQELIDPSDTKTGDIPSVISRVKESLLFAVLGIIVGVFIGYTIVVLLFVFSKRILSRTDVEIRYNIDILGAANNTCYHITSKRSAIQVGTLTDQMLNFIVANIRILNDSHHLPANILLTGTSGLSESQLIADKLTPKFMDPNDPTIVAAGNPLEAADAIISLSKVDRVILVEKLGVSQMGNVDRLAVKLDKANKEIVGIILI